ncbi:MAG TPA: hypothetical protein VKE22_10080 [Haliangiales bacterium]|nr:hypothetical protein [Haliangiales bacterium]
MNRSLSIAFLGACWLFAGGCGHGGADCRADAGLTVPSTLMLVSLSSEQRNEVCDFTACRLGGYGAKLSCSSGPAVTLAGSQQQCVAQTPTNPACHATVDDLVRCVDAIRANPCTSTLFGSDCAAVSDPACVTFTPGGLGVAPLG